MNPRLARPAAAGLLSCALAAAPAAAQTPAAADAWQWDASLYFWLPSIGGHSSFPAGSGSSVDISSEQVIDSLKMMAMGSVGARKGAWGVWTDLVYADFGVRKQGSRDFTIGGRPLPGGVDGQLDLDFKATGWTLAGSWRFAATPAYDADLLAGTRLLDLKQTLTWAINGDISGTTLPGRNGSAAVSLANWDAIVGVKGRAYLGSERRWFIPYHVDVGAGESQLTWQANAGIGYRFGWGSAVASYRYLAYEMKSGQAIQSLNFGGPLIGVAFQW